VLFVVGFLVAFFFTYILCYEHLTDELSGTALEYKDQVSYHKIMLNVKLKPKENKNSRARWKKGVSDDLRLKSKLVHSAEHWHTGWFSCKAYCCAFIS